MSESTQYSVSAGGSLYGELRVPGDKSISHRSVMLASLADGQSTIRGFLQGEDSLNTLRAFRDMGVEISDVENGVVRVNGVGIDGLQKPDRDLYLGNSGTSMRLMSGLLAGQVFDTTLAGDASLSSRPMARVVDPLEKMGAQIYASEGKRPPLIIRGGATLNGIDYKLPMASAQVKSCLLLAGLFAKGTTIVTEPAITRDHTERMLRGFSYPISVNDREVSLEGGHRLRATNLDVPADISSAAFFMVAASIVHGSDIMLKDVGVNPTRTGVIDILRLMGADITLHRQRESGGEMMADIQVKSAQLRGINIPESLVPLAIDEFPVLFIAAAAAEGETVLTGAEELRVKESDRIKAMAAGLKTLGVKARPLPDGIVINGGARLRGGDVDSFHDHRIAMAFAVAGLIAESSVTIERCDNVATSFPNFPGHAGKIGMSVRELSPA